MIRVKERTKIKGEVISHNLFIGVKRGDPIE
jgi:hypothetical protein